METDRRWRLARRMTAISNRHLSSHFTSLRSTKGSGKGDHRPGQPVHLSTCLVADQEAGTCAELWPKRAPLAARGGLHASVARAPWRQPPLRLSSAPRPSPDHLCRVLSHTPTSLSFVARPPCVLCPNPLSARSPCTARHRGHAQTPDLYHQTAAVMASEKDHMSIVICGHVDSGALRMQPPLLAWRSGLAA